MNAAFLLPTTGKHTSQPLFVSHSKFCTPLTLRSLEEEPRKGPVDVKTTPKASLSRSLSVLASVFPLVFFPTTAPHLQTSQAQHTQIRHSLLSSSHSPHAPFTLVSPALAEGAKPSPSKSSNDTPKSAESLSVTSIQRKMSFYISEFLMWHSSAKVLTLLAFTLIVMYLGSFLYRYADPKREEAAHPFWHSVRAVANPLEDDWQKNSLRVTSITMATFGMVVFAILVGMVTESVQSAVDNADGDNTHVVVSDHILVCGWSPHVTQILKDVASVSSNTKVVVMASADKKEMMQADVRSALPAESKQNLRIYYRPGIPTISQDLERVAAAHARKILLVKPQYPDPIDADRVTLSRALALRQNLPEFKGDVIVELSSARDESIVRSILSPSHAKSVETINTEQLLFRFMAQAIRQPGLADVVASMMGDNPSTVFHVSPAGEAAPEIIGKKFADLRPTSVPGAILCGFADSSGRISIENGGTFGGTGTVATDSKLLLLGQESGSPGGGKAYHKRNPVELPSGTSSMMQNSLKENSINDRYYRKSENFLVLGWRHDMDSMLLEFDSILPHGSTVTIVDQNVPSRLPVRTKRVKVNLVQKRADRYENIDCLMRESKSKFDHIVIIGSQGNNISDAFQNDEATVEDGGQDARSLATLIYVNDVVAKTQASRGLRKAPLVTVEFVSEDVADMARDQGGIANAILPQNLGAKITAQTVRDVQLNQVWRELLSQEGREVYLRTAGTYKEVAGERAAFSTIADRLANSNDDIVVGYIPRYMPKVKLNPQGNDRFGPRLWDANDTLVVLSKE